MIELEKGAILNALQGQLTTYRILEVHALSIASKAFWVRKQTSLEAVIKEIKDGGILITVVPDECFKEPDPPEHFKMELGDRVENLLTGERFYITAMSGSYEQSDCWVFGGCEKVLAADCELISKMKCSR